MRENTLFIDSQIINEKSLVYTAFHALESSYLSVLQLYSVHINFVSDKFLGTKTWLNVYILCICSTCIITPPDLFSFYWREYTREFSRFLMAHNSIITQHSAWSAIYGTRNKTQIGCLQGKCYACCTITLAPMFWDIFYLATQFLFHSLPCPFLFGLHNGILNFNNDLQSFSEYSCSGCLMFQHQSYHHCDFPFSIVPSFPLPYQVLPLSRQK